MKSIVKELSWKVNGLSKNMTVDQSGYIEYFFLILVITCESKFMILNYPQKCSRHLKKFETAELTLNVRTLNNL